MRTHRHAFRWQVGFLVGALGLGLGAVPPTATNRTVPAAVLPPGGAGTVSGKALGHVPGRLLVKLKSVAAVKALPLAPGGAERNPVAMGGSLRVPVAGSPTSCADETRCTPVASARSTL